MNTVFSGNWMKPEYESGLVSVIVPTYNRADLIVESLDSVWQQSYRPIELIIVDDGSTDDTQVVVNAWIDAHTSDSDFNTRLYFQKNAGVCAARNHALKICNGEYIQFLDSDDFISIDRLTKVVALFNKTACEYVETGFEGFYDNRGDTDEIHYGHDTSAQVDLLLKGTLWPNTLRATYRRSLIIRTGPWNESMVTLQDYEYVIRALVQPSKVHTEAIRDVLASARRDHGPRMSDIIGTREGRRLRVHCESLLCDRINRIDYISDELKRAFASRLYALGFRSNASGWPDYGKRCGELALSLGVELDTKGKLRHLVWKSGRFGGFVYDQLSKVRRVLGI